AQQKQTFLSRNLVAVVMVPTLIGIHFGWKMLQDNRKLVAEHEKIDMPPITVCR
ncbi:CG15922, partial [Drosophila busckii]